MHVVLFCVEERQSIRVNILEELWYGNVLPNDRDVRRGSRLHKLGALIIRHEEDLLPLPSEQAKEVFKKLRECQSELNGLNECEAFCTGFRLGARITYETMDGHDVPSIDD